MTPPPDSDPDGDGFLSPCDNCPGDDPNSNPLLEHNPSQADCDEDGVGDVCDNCPFRVGSQQNSDAVPAGDLCQCSDIDEDLDEDILDVVLMRRFSGAYPLPVGVNGLRCAVGRGYDFCSAAGIQAVREHLSDPGLPFVEGCTFSCTPAGSCPQAPASVCP